MNGKIDTLKGSGKSSGGKAGVEENKVEENKNGENKNGGSKKVKAGSLLLLGFFIVYVPSIFHWIYGSSITTDLLRMGVIEESFNASSFIVRDEVLLDSVPFSGKYIPEIAEGERTPAYGSVATVLESSSLDLLEKLEQKNMQIAEIQSKNAKNADLYSEDLSKIQDSINENIGTLVIASSSNTLSGIKPVRDSINKLIEKRTEIIGAGSNDATLQNLKRERDEIQKRIDSNTKQIRSQYSGVISYVIDGCEHILTPETIIKMLPKELDNIKPLNKEGYNDTATAGKPFVKVIKGNSMYIAAVMEKQKAEQLKEAGSIKVRINDIDKIYPAVVSSVSEASGGKCVISVKLERGIEELSNVRIINADFIKKMHEGLKIPLRSFKSVSDDGKTGVIVIVKANVSYERKVEILGKNNEYAIIRTPEDEKKTISLYDSYIIDPQNVEEGQIINQ